MSIKLSEPSIPLRIDVVTAKMQQNGWSQVNIQQLGRLFSVSAVDPHGRPHSGARDNVDSLTDYLIEIGALKPEAPVETASAELRALLGDEETIKDGKKRLLKEYDKLTQRLHDTRYLMSKREIERSEAISAILLELRK